MQQGLHIYTFNVSKFGKNLNDCLRTVIKPGPVIYNCAILVHSVL